MLNYRDPAGRAVVVVGVFAIEKEDRSQRLIVDARVPDCFSVEPEANELLTGAAFAQVRGKKFNIGGLVPKDAFYNLSSPVELQYLFGLLGILCGSLESALDYKLEFPSDQIIYLCFQVVPMGWIHALNLCQRVFEGIVERSVGVPSRILLCGFRPPPTIDQGICAAYVDNVVVMCQ